MPLLLKMLQDVDRVKNRTVRKTLGRDRIPTWALFGVQPIDRFETKSMFVANKSVKALKAIVDLRKAVDPDKKFAMVSQQLACCHLYHHDVIYAAFHLPPPYPMYLIRYRPLKGPFRVPP